MSGSQFDQIHILVVDDNAHMRQLVARMLHSFGVNEVGEAESSEVALDYLRKSKPDLMVLDWVMKGMSGLELVQFIRKDQQSPNPLLPVIMLTGHTSVERVQQARDAGVNEVIVKPVSPRTLMSRLVAVVDRPRPFVRTSTYVGPCRRRRLDNKHEGPERRYEDRSFTSEAPKEKTVDQ